MKLKVINPEILTLVRENNGYCPCKLEKTDDTKCPCLDIRKAPVGTECECRLYLKVACSHE